MFARMLAALYKKRPAVGWGLLLLLGLSAAYSNHFQNSFHFDDAHTIENNAALHSLRNIPRFFVDATTFSSLPSNQSYRPIVSTLFAIDYVIGGLNPCWFHLSIFALFVALVLLTAFVIHQLLETTAPSPTGVWIAFACACAALYGLHPANADTVNYIVASAEIISTLGIVASFAVYLKFPKARAYYFYAVPAALGILAKPPAAIFPVLFATYRALFPNEALCSHGPVDRDHQSGLRPLHRSGATTLWLREVIPPFVVCVLMLLFVQHMTPISWVAGARDAHNYLITQPYVALLYFKTFFWPNDLSADYDLNPFISTNDPRFWAGIIFVVLLVTMSILCARSKRTRVIGFGLLWFLICLLPTSLFPLAEVMNDHRTFLPYIGLIISFAGGITLLVCRGSSLLPMGRQRLPLQSGDARAHVPPKIITVCAILLILSINGFATFQRNRVWRTEETLWRDVTIKSPRNGRGLMNYGNTLMAKGDYAGALDYFHRALVFTPQYSVLFVNLAIAEEAKDQSILAEQHFQEALRLAPQSPDSYTFYGRYLLRRERIAEARALLEAALKLGPTDITARDLLKKADADRTIQTPESYVAASLEYYRQERYAETIAACQAALRLKPDYAEAWNNICAANNKLGRFEEAAAACEEALRYKPDFELARNNLQYARERKRDQ